jgi:GH25 family lysozyme M1 (1,4-beta-N-acetylmuramidase)
MSKPVVAYGIDVSEHNGNLSFNKLSPIPSFVILRVGYGTHWDRKAEAYRLQLENLGIPYGVYLYSYALNVEQAKAEAHFVLNAIANWDVKMGVWYDMEDADGYKAKNGVNSPATITALCSTFCSIVEDAGYYTGIYASMSWFGTKIIGLDRYDKWVAWWGTPNDGVKRTDTSHMGTLQQYSSTNGTMDRDCTFMDISVYNVQPKKVRKPIDQYALEVWQGKYGNGSARKSALAGTPYGYNAIQKRVNELGKIAEQVWQGKWSNGETRIKLLRDAGYDPNIVQQIVNIIGG